MPASRPELNLPADRQINYWQGFGGSAASMELAHLVRTRSSFFVFVARDSEHAIRIGNELAFYGGDIDVRLFPEWETLPYDNFSPHQDIVSERIETLYELPSMRTGVLVVPIGTLIQRLAPTEYVRSKALVLDVGGTFDQNAEREHLVQAGYVAVETVNEHGEFAIRGSLVDIFPAGSSKPVRIDLFDDEVESLRTFDPETQRTIDNVSTVRILPAHEVPLDKDGIARFRDAWHRTFDVDVRRCQVYQDVSSGLASQGVEYYLPLFFESTATLFDYIPEETVFVLDDEVFLRGNKLESAINARYESLRHDIERPILAPRAIYLDENEVREGLNRHARIALDRAAEYDRHQVVFVGNSLPDVGANHRAQDAIAKLRAFTANANIPVLLTAESAGRRAHLDEFLMRYGLNAKSIDDFDSFTRSDVELGVTIAPIDRGLWHTDFAVVTETEILGHRSEATIARERRRGVDPDLVVKNLSELHIGSPVVHLDHGVGRYRGLTTLAIDDQEQEFLALEYADEAKLYVPVTSLHLISRYSGADEDTAPLHRLGSDQWEKAKKRAAEKAHDVAVELLDIYARREAATSFQFNAPDADYFRFCEQFPFDVTPDQANAIDAVIGDLTNAKATDRLICGDVGFGKTEVAMRAAYVACQNHKQVALLVPTTLLAQQHYESFRDRFADWPVEIEVISRMRGEKDIRAVTERARRGRVDIVIGTHRLLGNDFGFKDLGLIIIDEEHRFGVRQKEQLKALRAHCDVLALTATPIPRTLNLAMSGMRDLSIIATPPARRLSIKTFIARHRRGLVKEAITRELARGGQVFYLHNEVRTIENTAGELADLIPEARVGVAHGQMPKRELEQVMADFYHRSVNVLVCSTIVENGIDVPNANTIIIERADRFGLAQLHQLRGRVGRSSRQAFAYLLTPHPKAMTEDAKKRLDAIEASGELGIGFTLATHDLEIRGAGELLGEDQSGQIETIGFSLYMEMLERAVEAIKSGRTPDIEKPLKTAHEVNLHAPSLIPDHYLSDVHARLILYKRINNATNTDILDDLKIEMIDRFGLLPDSVKNLFRTMEIKLQASALGVSKIDIGTHGGRLEFGPATTADPVRIVRLVQSFPSTYQLADATRLRVTAELEDIGKRFEFVETLLGQLSSAEAA